MPNTASENYIEQWGNDPPPADAPPEQKAAWGNLPDPAKNRIKQGVPSFQGMSPEQQAIAEGIWEKIQAGSPVDVDEIERLVESAKMPPGVKKWFYDTIEPMLTGANVPGVGKLFRRGKKALDVALGERVQDIYAGGARRGVLASGSSAAGVGGAIGAYSGSLADLMNYAFTQQQQMKQAEFGRGMTLAGFGRGWQQQDIAAEMSMAEMMNQLYTQQIGLEAGALDYLTQQQFAENQFALGTAGMAPYQPITGQELIVPGIGAGLAAIETFG